MKYKDKGDKTVRRGNDAELLVQSKLWRYGYNVKKLPNSSKGQPYDLLVDEKYAVEVKSAMLVKKNRWTFFGKHLLGADLGNIDVFAFVFFYPDNSCKIRYMKVRDLLNRKMKKTYYVVLNPNDKDLIKSPLRVFDRLKIKKGRIISGKVKLKHEKINHRTQQKGR